MTEGRPPQGRIARVRLLVGPSSAAGLATLCALAGTIGAFVYGWAAGPVPEANTGVAPRGCGAAPSLLRPVPHWPAKRRVTEVPEGVRA